MITTKIDPAANPSGAIIAYNNLLTATTYTDADKSLTPNTWERLRESSGSKTIKYQLSTSATVDFIAIAGHNLSGETFDLQVATTIGGSLTTVATVSPSDNNAILETFTAQSVAEIAISGTFSGDIEIAYVSAGEYLQMPRNIYGGHSPIDLSSKTKFQTNVSETGQFLGRDITRQGSSTSLAWQFLDDAWYRTSFTPFVESAKTNPFFIKWRPDFYEDATSFCFTTADIKPSNMGGGHRLMSVTVPVLGHQDT